MNYGVKQIENWKFDKVDLPDQWKEHLGDLSENFRMLIQGPPGHGKTEYVIMLSKMLAINYGKVHFNSVEQGKSNSFHTAFMRNEMHEMASGIWMLGDKKLRTFDPYFKKMQKGNSGKILIIDSLDYMKLTFDQFMELDQRFPKKTIIIVCWSEPMDTAAKKIKYRCDIKVEIKDYRAIVRSRFGGNKPFIIWKEGFLASKHKGVKGQFAINL